MKSHKYKYSILLIYVIFYIVGCTDPVDDTPIIETSTVTDVDGNVYKTVKIGKQWWMAEDLKTKHFNDGVNINESKENVEWVKAIPSYCFANESSQNNALLYNYYVIENEHSIAPKGWHIPTDGEWMQLEMFIGLSQADVEKVNWRGDREGEKLMVQGGTEWTRQFDDPIWGTDYYGFSAKANGCRLFDGRYGDPGFKHIGMWWTSSISFNEAWYRHLDYKKANIFRYFASKNYGFSIRCVKD